MNSSEIFKYIFDGFNKKGVEYVILHSYEKLPFEFESDIDTAIKVKSINEAIRLLEETIEETDWRIIQFWRHEYYAADCVISNDDEFLQVDFCIHYERDGRVLIDIDRLIENRIKTQNFYVPYPAVEFTYILLKKVLKKKFKDGSIERLERLLDKMTEEEKMDSMEMLKNYFGINGTEQIWEACCLKKYESLDLELYSSMILKNTSTIFGNLKYLAFDIYRKAYRIAHPTGLFVVLLGVDGAGKSTIAEEYKKRYENAFRKIHHYHSRVRVLKDINQITNSNPTIDVSAPHSKRKNGGPLISIVKLAYYLFDFLIGNILVTKDRIKSTLILIERYYYDYYIDPVRYNLRLSEGYIKFFEKFIKKPDVIFVFVGNPQIIYERKKEITLQEIIKQTEKLETNMRKKKNVVYIDTTAKDIDGCVLEMMKKSNDILRQRYQKNR